MYSRAFTIYGSFANLLYLRSFILTGIPDAYMYCVHCLEAFIIPLQYYNMSQQSVSEFNIFEGNSTVENATHLMMIIDYDVGQCDEDDDTIPCTYVFEQADV